MVICQFWLFVGDKNNKSSFSFTSLKLPTLAVSVHQRTFSPKLLVQADEDTPVMQWMGCQAKTSGLPQAHHDACLKLLYRNVNETILVVQNKEFQGIFSGHLQGDPNSAVALTKDLDGNYGVSASVKDICTHCNTFKALIKCGHGKSIGHFQLCC